MQKCGERSHQTELSASVSTPDGLNYSNAGPKGKKLQCPADQQEKDIAGIDGERPLVSRSAGRWVETGNLKNVPKISQWQVAEYSTFYAGSDTHSRNLRQHQ